VTPPQQAQAAEHEPASSDVDVITVADKAHERPIRFVEAQKFPIAQQTGELISL